MTETLVSGSSRSISAAFCPIFWARAWQARWTVTPPSSGVIPGASPSLRAMSTRYSLTSKVAAASFLTAASSGKISGHSNLNINAQDGTSATMS